MSGAEMCDDDCLSVLQNKGKTEILNVVNAWTLLKTFVADNPGMTLSDFKNTIESFVEQDFGKDNQKKNSKVFLVKLLLKHQDENWQRVFLELHHNANGELDEVLNLLGYDTFKTDYKRTTEEISPRADYPPRFFENARIMNFLKKYRPNLTRFVKCCNLTNASIDDIGRLYWPFQDCEDINDFILNLSRNRTLQKEHMQIFADLIQTGSVVLLGKSFNSCILARNFNGNNKCWCAHENIKHFGFYKWMTYDYRHGLEMYSPFLVELFGAILYNPQASQWADILGIPEFYEMCGVGKTPSEIKMSLETSYCWFRKQLIGDMVRYPIMKDVIDFKRNWSDEILIHMRELRVDLIKEVARLTTDKNQWIYNSSVDDYKYTNGRIGKILDNKEFTQKMLSELDGETFVLLFPYVADRPHKFTIDTWMLHAYGLENLAKLNLSALTEHAILTCGHIKLDMKKLSRYGRISWEFVYNHPEYEWDYEMLSYNYYIV